MARGVTLLDGAVGTELRARGVEVPSHITSIWSAKALLNAPDAVLQVHRDYIEAGADVITANNYAVTPPLLAREGLEARVEELTGLALDLAERARDAAGRDVRIAGSLPPLDTSYRADLVGGDDTLARDYARIAGVLARRADILLCETMASAREAVAAVSVATRHDREVWVSWTLQGDWPDHLPSGETVAEAYDAIAPLAPDACLVNCCGANLVTGAVGALAGRSDRPVGGYANAAHVVPRAGEVRATDGEIQHRPLDEEGYAAEVLRWLEAGARIVGGCCGTRPSYIARLRHLIDA